MADSSKVENVYDAEDLKNIIRAARDVFAQEPRMPVGEIFERAVTYYEAECQFVGSKLPATKAAHLAIQRVLDAYAAMAAKPTSGNTEKLLEAVDHMAAAFSDQMAPSPKGGG